IFFFYYIHPLLLIHSFPTRRSSDLFERDHFLPPALRGDVGEWLDGLPASAVVGRAQALAADPCSLGGAHDRHQAVRTAKGTWIRDRKSTRLNSSHVAISYAVFCLKK